MTRNDRLAAYLIARPHEWIDGRTLSRHGGIYAWRSRISDLRRARGMVIENRQTPYWDGVETYIVSEYRYIPAVSA